MHLKQQVNADFVLFKIALFLLTISQRRFKNIPFLAHAEQIQAVLGQKINSEIDVKKEFQNKEQGNIKKTIK